MDVFKASKIEPINYVEFLPLTQINILRDDLIHPIVCGNKWRKLKNVVSFLRANAYETLVTFGGAYSNHVVATAFAGNYFDIKTHAFIRGDEERSLNHYEKICIENKMTLHHVSRLNYKDKIKLFNDCFEANDKTFFLDEGGNHPLAIKGCAEIIEELDQQYDYIILPLGTGTTMEGLLQGIIKAELPTKVVGISSLKNNFDLDKRMIKYPQKHWEIFHNYHRGKYGKTDEELLNFIQHFSSFTGVPLESVYTGKMMMAFIDLIRQDYFKTDSRILLLHTGGLLNI